MAILNGGDKAPSMSVPVLAQVEAKVESQLLPDNKEDYLKVVTTGMRTAMAKGPEGYLGKLKESKQPVRDIAVGAVNLALLMRVHSRYTMPVKAMVPAALTLMLHGLDVANRLGLVKVDQNVVNTATHIFTEYLLRSQGLTPQMISHAAQVVHGITQDPNKMDVIARRTGVVRHPMASEPTPLPGPEEGEPNGV